MPRVSVGMPVYNGEKYIKAAIDSILAQSFDDFELIISDNASIDATERICREYAAKDRRIRYYRNGTNLGAARNFNRVFELSSGEYFKWAAHDDVCDETFLTKCMQVLDRDDSVVLCHAKTKIIDEHGRMLSLYDKKRCTNSPMVHDRFHDLVLLHIMCFEIFGLIRAEILRQTPLISNFTSTDRILLGELSLHGRFFEIPEYLFFRRNHLQCSSKVFNHRSIIVWLDPSKAGRLAFPRWAIFLEYCKAIKRGKLDWWERVGCYIVMAKWLWRNWKGLIYDLVVAATCLLTRLNPAK
jgi:glycosyltransferase involved in cell wall biosynthesis